MLKLSVSNILVVQFRAAEVVVHPSHRLALYCRVVFSHMGQV